MFFFWSQTIKSKIKYSNLYLTFVNFENWDGKCWKVKSISLVPLPLFTSNSRFRKSSFFAETFFIKICSLIKTFKYCSTAKVSALMVKQYWDYHTDETESFENQKMSRKVWNKFWETDISAGKSWSNENKVFWGTRKEISKIRKCFLAFDRT